MPRKFFRKFLPGGDAMRQHRFMHCLGPRVQHPNLWHLNRRSVSGGMAAGLFAGLVPGSHLVKFAVAAAFALLFRVNLPLAVIVTLYTNPFTVLPLYVLAYQYGKLLIGGDGGFAPAPDLEWSHLGQWMAALLDWMATLGRPLAVGLVALGLTLAAIGYAAVRIGWRVYVTLAWRRRARLRAARA
jgi:uncharacterized protein (DUF2062 family)